MAMVIRVCHYCGKEYRTHDSVRLKYCSNTCYGLDHRRGEMVKCAYCGDEFYRLRSKPNQTYCSQSCSTTARNLTEQNPSYTRDISGERNPMYGKGLHGAENPMYGKKREQNPNWRGGRKIRKDGYTLVIAPDDHPSPAYVTRGTKYILEHRYVMEQHLGRYLDPKEVIHHKDGNPRNNSIDNLRLFASQAEHIRVAHGGKGD